MTEAKWETKCNMDYKIFLILSLILLIPLISANTFGYNYLNNQPTGNITNEYINNTYINQTIEVNETQFDTDPLTIKTSWLTSFITSVAPIPDLTPYARLDGTNQPFTGNLEVRKATPEIILKNVDSDEYSRIIRNSENNTFYLKNRVLKPSIGKAIRLDGTNDFISVASMPKPADFTFSLWIKPATYTQGGYAALLQGNTGTNTLWNLYASGNKLYRRISTDAARRLDEIDTLNSTNYPSGQWVHIVLVVNSVTGESYFYRDGNLVNTVSNGGIVNGGATSSFAIGRWLGGTTADYHFNGDIDEVAVWNRALSSSEVSLIYNSGTGLYGDTSIVPFNSGLLAGWHLDEGTLITANDFSGNSRTGTLTNGPRWIEGKIRSAEEIVEINLITSIDGTNDAEEGKAFFGGSNTYTLIDGKELVFAIGGTVVGSFGRGVGDTGGTFTRFWLGGTPANPSTMFYIKETASTNGGLLVLEGQDGGKLRVDTFDGHVNLDNSNVGNLYMGRDMYGVGDVIIGNDDTGTMTFYGTDELPITLNPNSMVQLNGNLNTTGTVYYGALQANSPHALLEDESGYTRICMKATDGKVVYQTIQNINGIYQSVYVQDTTGVCTKVLLKSQIGKTEPMNVSGEITFVTTVNKTYENIWTKEKTQEIIRTIKENLSEYESNKYYKAGDYFKFNGKAYEVIQSHTSQLDWLPDETPALYKVLVLHQYNEISEWKQPLGSHDCYPLGAKVTYQGKIYESLNSCNVWVPPTLWREI